MKAAELMSRPALSCRNDESANAAARVMWEADVGCVLVVDGQGQLEGLVTDRDLCMAAYTRGVPLDAIALREVMSTGLVVAGEGELLGYVEALMRSRQVRRVPLVDAGGRPVGVLSLGDVAREARAQRGRRAPEVAGEEVASTLGAIAERRPVGRV